MKEATTRYECVTCDCFYLEPFLLKLEIVPEPEASLTYALQCLKERSESPIDLFDADGMIVFFLSYLKIVIVRNAAYLVCDFGDSTANVSVYGFRSTLMSTHIVELVKDVGISCCERMLDELFFTDVFGKKVIPNWPEIARQYPAEASRILRSWQRLRNAFNGGSSIVLDIPPKLQKLVDHKAFPDVEDEELVGISATDIDTIFGYVMTHIYQLIEQQVKAIRSSSDPEISGKPIVTFLVGGLSESPYIQAKLKLRFEGSHTVYVPPSPASAVFRGAVLSGLNPSLFHVRRARRYYGCEALRIYNPRKDLDRPIVNVDGRDLMKIIVPFVWKGTVIHSEDWIQREFVPAHPDDRRIPIKLFSTEHDKFAYPTDPGVHQIGVINIDIPEGLPDKTIVLEMNYSGPTIKVRGYTKANRDIQAPVTINFDL